MNHNKSRIYRCWTFVLVVFTVTESRYASYGPLKVQGPSRASSGFVQSPFSTQKHESNSKPVSVKCHSDAIEVVVQADLFDTGLLLNPEYLRLGSPPASEGRSCRASQTEEGTLLILADLLDCGTRLSSTGDILIYSNVLIYSPKQSSDGLFRLDGAAIPVECHFDKKYSVDEVSLYPTWVPWVSVASAHHYIGFRLRLMTDNWQFVRRSHTYYLGDPMHFEVSAVVRKHKPLRVYVDHCVATDAPDPQSTARYDFIERNGVEEHTLRFQLDAFRFHQGPSSQVYITCWLKAVPTTSAVSSQNRACSFVDNRWMSVDGEDQVCRTCDPLAVKEETTTERETEQPMKSMRNFALTNPKQSSSSLQVRPRMFPGHKSQQSFSELMNSKAERIIQFGPLTVK
uniref:zona pellucida sperm-binding protein 3-like isoform X2 n=1 Tax=Doryrhamphus excisus TaxID=161450 RepID=UPI0025ADD698|nr:zona pellucida sperm-binding protein 3-like isoform X2 [Doryrhamphus excisus]